MNNNKGARLGRQDMQIVAEETGYQGFFRLLKVRLRHRLFAGGWSPTLTRELFDRGHAAAVLPYDPVRDEVVLVEQFRVGAIHHHDSPWLLEIVAGIVEPGESEEAVVRREAEEEAGLTLGRLTRALGYFSSPGGCSERITVFVGEVDASQAATHAGLADEGEDIRVHRLPREQAMQWLEDGRIDNAASVIALQWLALKREAGLWQ
ncbi:ADP-ribose pyrophosphatase [Oceanimonas sp. GK1]|uniref:ADP-ribose diphosphatase n=1 Tax=Oceanimonas sp. (strain GK1 / IBRC-M 10197) TaxID=511062 RepID=UPI00024953F7|nr:ADP-ribose diphosphatase [Oceanimonas sp. GK1]AEY02865.1 ADP-ribose pyrophosphatase [Oceanimonas sp. GK1]